MTVTDNLHLNPFAIGGRAISAEPASAADPILALLTEHKRRERLEMEERERVERRERELLTDDERKWLRKRDELYQIADEYAFHHIPSTAQKKFEMIDRWREHVQKLEEAANEIFDQIKKVPPMTIAGVAALLREWGSNDEITGNVLAFLDTLAPNGAKPGLELGD